ncbi:transposon Ty3-G Gag-Pol polyprotein [Trichonephila clavipes]|nr:transposon Ty3-G Gag-Pol polyprotein [Trichonephila clavipes]
MSEDDPMKWFKYVPSLQEVFNSTFQRSINTTPFELLFGTQINNKIDLRIQQLIDEQLQLEFNKNRELLRKAAKAQIIKVQNENKKSYNLRRKSPYLYSVKDLVAIIKERNKDLDKNSAINLSRSGTGGEREDDIQELIMGHEDELTIEELQEVLKEEHQETQRNVSPSEQEED